MFQFAYWLIGAFTIIACLYFDLGFGIILGAFIGGLFSLGQRKLRVTAPRTLDKFLPWPLPLDFAPVRIRYLRRLRIVREDDGIAAFVDGWLVVNGLRADFSVRSTDLPAVLIEPAGMALDLGRYERVEILPYDKVGVAGSAEGAFEGRFNRCFHLWQEEREATPGEPIMPPIIPPKLFIRRPLTWLLLGSLLFYFGLASSAAEDFTPVIVVETSLSAFGLGMIVAAVCEGKRFADYASKLPREMRRRSLL